MCDVSRRTEISPRFVRDTLVFYEGDVFDIAFTFDLSDESGEAVKIGKGDTLKFIFKRNGRLPEMVEEEIQGEDVTDNIAVLHFTPELSGKFARGEYEYRIQYRHGTTAVTVAAHSKMVVE